MPTDYTHRSALRFINARIVLLVVGSALVALGGLQLSMRYKALHQPFDAGTLTKTVTVSTPSPSENKVSIHDTYTVAAYHPKILRIPQIGVEHLIQKVDVDQHNDIAAPVNVHVAGWYVKSAIPGTPGVSIIDGHVAGRYASGVFKDLHKLKPGDEFSIEFGNGASKRFAVLSIREVTATEADTALFNKDPAVESQLTLITCSGAYDTQSATYKNRTIVYSTLL